MNTRTCNLCKRKSDETTFNKGQRYCRDCQRAYNRKWHKEHREEHIKATKQWVTNNRERVQETSKNYSRELRAANKYSMQTKARALVNSYIRQGKLTKPIVCSHCGKRDVIEGHHEDYSKPLEVTWLCGECHRLVHKNPRECILE